MSDCTGPFVMTCGEVLGRDRGTPNCLDRSFHPEVVASTLLPSLEMVLSSEWAVPISGVEDSHETGKLADFTLSHSNPGFVFVSFAFAISMVLRSFSCPSDNPISFTVLRTSELKMAKVVMVVAISGKTRASQLSGSPGRLHLQTIMFPKSTQERE